MNAEMPATPKPVCNYDTESRNVTFVEFEFSAALDDWLPVSPERAAELRRKLGPPWNQPFPPPADPPS